MIIIDENKNNWIILGIKISTYLYLNMENLNSNVSKRT